MQKESLVNIAVKHCSILLNVSYSKSIKLCFVSHYISSTGDIQKFKLLQSALEMMEDNGVMIHTCLDCSLNTQFNQISNDFSIFHFACFQCH